MSDEKEESTGINLRGSSRDPLDIYRDTVWMRMSKDMDNDIKVKERRKSINSTKDEEHRIEYTTLQTEKKSEEIEHVERDGNSKLEFGVKDTPPIHIMVIYALQMVMSNLMGPLAVVHVFRDQLCAKEDNDFFTRLFSSSIFMCGLCTYLQVTFGLRLPIFQGSSFMFMPPMIIMMQSGRWSCDPPVNNGTNMTTTNDELWREPVLEISGSLAVASLIQVILGTSGAIGFLMRFIGPLTVVPVISLIGLAMFQPIVAQCQHSWAISALTLVIILLCAVVIDHWEVPMPSYKRGEGFHWVKYPIFKIFANVWGIIIAWIVSGILTATGVFTDDKDEIGYMARTDTRLNALQEAPWFYFPYPGQWGAPTIGVSAFVGMCAATISSIIESVGDYIATAPVCQVPPPPRHAINRGVALEGFGSILSALVGTCHGTTSYSNMMGFIIYTGVASRIMWQLLGVMLMLFGVFNKFGAFITLIPDPIVGTLLLVGLAALVGVSLANLGNIDMQSSRNQLVLGVSLLMGMCMPYFMQIRGQQKPFVGVVAIDQVISMFLSTAPFVGGVTGFILDNLLPGTKKSRGFHDPEDVYNRQRGSKVENIEDVMAVYYPIRPITRILVKFALLQKLPFLPKIESTNW